MCLIAIKNARKYKKNALKFGDLKFKPYLCAVVLAYIVA